MNEKMIDYGMCMAFLMEGIVDYEVSRGPKRHDPFPDMGRDGVVREIFSPIAVTLSELMQVMTEMEMWDRVKGGVFMYEVVSSIGWRVYAQALSAPEEIEPVIADTLNDYLEEEDSKILADRLSSLVAIATKPEPEDKFLTPADIRNLLERGYL